MILPARLCSNRLRAVPVPARQLRRVPEFVREPRRAARFRPEPLPAGTTARATRFVPTASGVPPLLHSLLGTTGRAAPESRTRVEEGTARLGHRRPGSGAAADSGPR